MAEMILCIVYAMKTKGQLRFVNFSVLMNGFFILLCLLCFAFMVELCSKFCYEVQLCHSGIRIILNSAKL